MTAVLPKTRHAFASFGQGCNRLRRFSVEVRAESRDVLLTRTPHSGFHIDGNRDFMEGWYYRVTDPNTKESVALIYSYEQGQQNNGDMGRIGIQIMGPDDTYIAQTSSDISTFWGDRNRMRLGACLKQAPARTHGVVPRKAVPEAVFQDIIEEGFQVTETFHQGCIIDSPGTCPGSIPADVPFAYWSFTVQPVYGWGNAGQTQQSTAGWLTSLPVFEPHWQVLMAHGLASGYVQWGPDRRITLDNAPLYSEKNWGQGFPKKWAWAQCNTFKGQPHLTMTAVCAIRTLVTPTIEEKLGMIGVHYKGSFIEVVPWKGPMTWDVDTWGRWHFWGKTDEYEVLVEAYCDQSAGVILRAPLGKEGLAPACKDTFAGSLRLRMWELDPNGGARKGDPFVDASSSSAALEVGGGPWWGPWKEESEINPAVAAAVNAPVDLVARQIEDLVPFEIPSLLKPPGY